MSDNKKEYGAQSIRVIEGLEAVRKRPAMYIGSTGVNGLHHLVYEIVDNSVDEALAGYCDKIEVILHTDGSCSVEDNGRGIPTGIHPTENISAAEVALTKLHAGGKFDKDVYKYSGGLHGVGVSVVNALSQSLELIIYQNNKVHVQSYQQGKPLGSLKVTQETKKRGTYIRFLPDPEIFRETTTFSFDVLSSRFRELAFLNKGLKIFIKDERTGKSHEFYFEGGIISFVEHINSKKTPLFSNVIYNFKEDEQSYVEIALQYNDSYTEQLFSFVNNINTIEGGTHVAGFKAALTKVCNKRGQDFNILKDSESFSSEDVREGLVGVINLKIAEPQFEGQTKAKLGNSEVKGLIESWVGNILDTFFEENPAVARKILQKAYLAMQSREAARKAREITRRKTVLESVVLPGKLADCSSENPSESELFIVEGDSAGGSAKSARDRFTQAILPLKGKILNVEKARFDKILSNEEIRSLISAVGTGIGETDFNLSKARYHKIILMTDADVDGSHIRTLLLTFFFRYMKDLIENGYLYIAKPPLYKAKIGKKEQYLIDEKSFKKFLIDWIKENGDLIINGQKLNSLDYNLVLDNLLRYYDQLQDLARTFKLHYVHLNQIIEFLFKNPLINQELDQNLDNQDNMDVVVNKLRNYFKGYSITLDKKEDNYILSFKQLNNDWSVNFDLFNSPEAYKLVEMYNTLDNLNSNWTLKISDRERSVSDKGILNLMSAIVKISKPYMSVQRYKGLGEMNPQQLWETAMDPKARTLIQVKIGDALEADSWFDTLMGSDVGGRREFIEEYGIFAKNLDI